jgi:hypothetical protein
MPGVGVTPTEPDGPERPGSKDLENDGAHSSQISADYKREALTIKIPLQATETSVSPNVGMEGKGCGHECSSCGRKVSTGTHIPHIAFVITNSDDSENRAI